MRRPQLPKGPFVPHEGQKTEPYYEFCYTPSGRTWEKLSLRDYTQYGLGAMGWDSGHPVPQARPFTVRDLEIENVGKMPPEMDGRGEACLWLGNTCKVHRVSLTNGTWMALWTGAACDKSVITDVTIPYTPNVGIYCEHETTNTRFSRLKIHSGAACINVEWWYGNSGSHHLIIEDFDLTSDRGYCMFLDAGTHSCTIRNGKLSGWAGIAHPQYLAPGGSPNQIDWASIDTSGLQSQDRREWNHDHNLG